MRQTLVAVIAITVITLAGIGAVVVTSSDDSDGKDTIAVTMSWEKDIADSIVGDRFNVVSMMGSNVSPHEDYTKPSNVKDLYRSVLYFEIGTGVEWETAFLSDVAKDIPSSVTVISIADSIEYVPLPNPEGHHHHDGDEDEPATDAHIWTSPDNLRKVAELIAAKVTEIDRDNASVYEANLSEYLKRADEVDVRMQELAAILGPGQRNVMVWHPAWQYLLEQYATGFGADLHMESVETDGEVTPAEAADIVKEEGCTSIYVSTTDEGYEGRKALEEAGITVHVVNPTADDMLTAIGMFIGFLEADAEA